MKQLQEVKERLADSDVVRAVGQPDKFEIKFVIDGGLSPDGEARLRHVDDILEQFDLTVHDARPLTANALEVKVS